VSLLMEINDCGRTKSISLPISLIILTHNEEENIEYCLKNVIDWVDSIFIVDSYSTDRTLELAKTYTNKIYQHEFKNHAKQLNWALENLPVETEWVMRLDADESPTTELINELTDKLPNLDEEITGLYIKRRLYFMGKWIKHGGYYPTWLLRIWRRDKCYCEEKCMDEHMTILEGTVLFMQNDIIDENRKNLHWWIVKHNDYAIREAIDILNLKYGFSIENRIDSNLFGRQEHRKRWLKENVFAKSPIFLRSFLYFIYRYFIRFGFLDGREGLIWHFLQGFWYRFLVDSKIYEIRKKAAAENRNVNDVIYEMYGIEVGGGEAVEGRREGMRGD
jgi:glycosyltransferase involved in cell wall biosynthesis